MSGFTFEDFTDDAKEFVVEHLKEVVEAGAIIMRDEIIRTMEASQPAGAEYPIPGTGSTYTASAPDQAPAIREGRYRESWDYTPAVQTSEGEWVATAYTDLLVGQYVLGELLEYGTLWILPRPHVRVSIPRAQEKLRQLVEGS